MKLLQFCIIVWIVGSNNWTPNPYVAALAAGLVAFGVTVLISDSLRLTRWLYATLKHFYHEKFLGDGVIR